MKQPKTFKNAVTKISLTETETNLETAGTLETVTSEPAAGGLPMRTDLRAGLAWDDLDDKAQELWGNLTASLSNLTSGDAG